MRPGDSFAAILAVIGEIAYFFATVGEKRKGTS
jgi:hypothetical protein